jgi:hypothetical protein
MGWAGVTNGELLRRAAADRFDVFVTIDQGMPHQQDLRGLELAIVLLAAESNRLSALLPLVPSVLASLDQLQPGHVVRLSAD